MRKVLGLLAVVVLTTCSFAANITYVRVDEAVVESRLALKPVDQAARLTMLHNQFLKAGCTADQIKEQHVTGQDQPNLICTLPGTEPGSIVIGARSDYQSKGDELKVDWATLTTLPLLAESLVLTPHRYSLVFVAFTGHKDLAGSAAYLKSLSDDERKAIRAMIDLDQIGRTPATFSFATVQAASGLTPLGPTKQITHDDTPMSKLLPLAAITLKDTNYAHQNREQLFTDAQNFERAGTLALTITSPAYTKLIRPGNTEVSMARTELDPKVYYQTYNLLCVYTLYLDRGIAPPRSKPATDVAKAVAAPASASIPATASAPSAAEPTASPAAIPASAAAIAKPLLPSTAQPVASTPPPVAQAPAETSPAPTFRSTTRLVQVDVVVTDKAGNPITGLKEADFTVFQDGKPQPVRAFEAHVLTPEARKTRVAPTLPANTYTNLPESIQDQSWTIVLYDQLNTPTSDQQVARQQLVKVLKTLPAGTPVALFLLGQRVEMLQGFSRDPNALVAVAEKLHPDSSLLLTTEGERQNVIGFETYRAIMAAPDGMADSQLQRVKQQYNDQEDARTKQRLLFTLDALKAMARAVSGYPGRKSLIWLSGSFPIRLEPNQAAMDPFRNSADYMMELARATALLSESRVAVYPIDVRGILTSGMDVSVPSSYGSMAYTGGKQQIANGSNDQASGLLHEQFTSRSNEHEAMTEAAYQTGGRAFLTNDFADAMKKAMNDGSTFYTIAYTPPEQKDKSEPYHHIEVKLSRPDTNLSYRRGYYSTPQKMTAAEGTAALQGALQPGMPPATMLYVMASVQPPTGKQKTVKINYIISPSNVTFSDLPENKKHVVVDCMVVAFDKDGKEVAHASDTLDGAIPQAAYDAVMKQGLPANQEIELKPGTYNLRLGVMDHATQQIGTVDVPLEITDGSLGK